MKNVRGFFYGLAIAIAMSATAATVYNYFPPPGMAYSPSTGFVVGSATGGAQGAGTLNAQGVFINGAAVVTGGSVPSPASPTASVGLTVVNGSGTAYMLANAAPPLSQTITPTWTGAHIFTPSAGVGITVNAFTNQQALVLNGATNTFTNAVNGSSTSGQSFGTLISAGTTSADTAFQIRNQATTATFVKVFGDGGTVLGSATGGDQGVGTLNMQGCFVNGVACSTGGAAGANPTGTVGLTAVNGSAGTYMRSDAAPPLSQSISPTWTGAHTFSQAQGSVGFTLSGPNTGVGWNMLFADTTNTANRGFIGIGTNTVTGAAVTDFAISPGASGSVVIGTANGGAIGTRFGPSGNVIINAPSSGVPLIVGGVGSSTQGAITASAGPFEAGGIGQPQMVLNASGANFGLIQNDASGVWSLAYNTVANTLGTPILKWTAAGGVQIGAPTGGDEGVGTVNANSYYASGVNVTPVYAVINSGASSCTVGANFNLSSTTCSRISTGVYQITPAHTVHLCTGNILQGSVAIIETSGGSTLNVTEVNTSGTAVDLGSIQIVCF